jgi:hypothetical protein
MVARDRQRNRGLFCFYVRGMSRPRKAPKFLTLLYQT